MGNVRRPRGKRARTTLARRWVRNAFALMAAQHRLGVKHRQLAMVGDQLYADRMAAALYGIPGLVVIPRGPDLGAQVVLKRKWEKKHWQAYYDKGGKTL